MYNYLRTDRASAFGGWESYVPLYTRNLAGGAALWDVPPVVSCANNPIVFTRTRYLYWADGYESPFSFRPNVISVGTDGNISFRYALASVLYVRLSVLDDDDESAEFVACVEAGETDFDLLDRNLRAQTILGVSLTGNGEDWADVVEDGSYAYFAAGVEWEDDNHVCGADGITLYRNTEVDSSDLTVYREDGTYTILTVEDYGGVAKFDVSAVVRQWLSDGFADMDADLVADGSLYARFTVKGIGGSGWEATFLAVNAVAQVGESSDMEACVGGVLTGFPRLFHYDGYPLDYSVLAGEDDVETARGTAEAMTVTRMRADDAYDLLGDGDGDLVGTEAGAAIGLRTPLDVIVIDRCTPRNPFYVRWLNRLGGIDYFMFSRQQTLSRTVKSVSSYSPFAEDPAEAGTNRRNYALTTEHTVTVGAENVAEDVFGELERMPFSPRIEWWSESVGRWIVLAVSKFTGERGTRYERGSFEVTFALPDINTQF